LNNLVTGYTIKEEYDDKNLIFIFFSQILNPKGIEIFWLFSRFLYIFLLVWLFKFCEFKYIGVLKMLTFTFVMIDSSFFIICFHSAGIDFLTMDVRKQIIWGNKFIKYKGKSLMIENWINSGIIFINDIIDHQGNISEVVILHNLICKQNWMSETSIVKKSMYNFPATDHRS
jgi:hypothetical protein